MEFNTGTNILIHAIIFFIALVITIITISEYGRQHEQFSPFFKLIAGLAVFSLISFAELVLVHALIYKDSFMEIIYNKINI